MKRTALALILGGSVLATALPAMAQTPLTAQPVSSGSDHKVAFPTDDPVIRQIWDEGMNNTQTFRLAQVLLDSLGPRLVASPGEQAAMDWTLATYRSWGIDARKEEYGVWTGWRRGITHVDLIAPRVRTLEATMLAWSPGTRRPVEGDVVVLPEFDDAEEFNAWLPKVKGKFVMTSVPQISCRPDATWNHFATPASLEKLKQDREEVQRAWNARVSKTGLSARDLPVRLEEAGAAGILTSTWSGGYGVTRIFNARTRKVPTLDLSCEDYGLLFRLAEHDQGPKIRVNAQAEFLGDLPTYNLIAEIKGTEKPEEYVMLSAHFDSWDGSSGATDNGTGTVVMMEAMRILKKVYPNPKRTILVGHWSGEEQGLNGSRAFAQDNPEIVRGLQALFNQDNGTGRVVNISMQGFTEAGAHFGRWLSSIPTEITQHIQLQLPGTPGTGGTDHASFVCHGAPAFNLSALDWEYRNYTWHTNRDTFDKIVFDDLKNNAVLVAMLAYLAAEDPERVSREQRELQDRRTGTKASWPVCPEPVRDAKLSPRM